VSEQNGDNPRLKQIEEHIAIIFRMQADIEQEHQSLLRAQVVQGDEMQKIRKRTDEKFQALAEAQTRMDDALAAVMGTLDGFGKRTDQRFEELSAANAEAAKRTEIILQELAASQQQTDAALKALIERLGR
jgi:methyl-accepting chemotaxis protein